MPANDGYVSLDTTPVRIRIAVDSSVGGVEYQPIDGSVPIRTLLHDQVYSVEAWFAANVVATGFAVYA